jgi:hypothetical protein
MKVFTGEPGEKVSIFLFAGTGRRIKNQLPGIPGILRAALSRLLLAYWYWDYPLNA